METIVLIIHVLLAAAVIGLILIQQGKGAEAGASFGGGASQTVFGSQGSGSFLGRVTAILAAGIFVTSFVLAVFAKEKAASVGDAGIPDAATIEAAAQVEQASTSELPVASESEIPTAGDN